MYSFKDYYPTIQVHVAPDEYKHLFDLDLYKTCNKGAGFYKFKIKSIKNLPRDPDEDAARSILIGIRGTHWGDKSTTTYINAYYKDQELLLENPKQYFFKLVHYYLGKRPLRNTKQYKHEEKEIKKKYPEYFL